MRFFLEEGGQLFGKAQGLGCVVRNTLGNQGFGKAHQPQANPTVGARDRGDLRQGIRVHVQDVIQKPDAQPDEFSEPHPIKTGRAHERGQVNGAEGAAFVGVERLLAAGVGGRNGAAVGRGVFAVDFVQEDEPGITNAPGMLGHGPEQLFGIGAAHHAAGPRVAKRDGLTERRGPHETVGHPHRQVEVGELIRSGFEGNEGLNVRVVGIENTHVGAAPSPTLFDHFRGVVEEFNEGKCATCFATSRGYPIAGRAQGREIEAGAAARLVDLGRVLDGVKNAFQVVFYREDKAGGQLAVRTAGVHEGGGVGQKLQPLHGPEGTFGKGVFFCGWRAVAVFGFCYGMRNTTEQLGRRFHKQPAFVALQVAPLQDLDGVHAQGQFPAAVGVPFAFGLGPLVAVEHEGLGCGRQVARVEDIFHGRGNVGRGGHAPIKGVMQDHAHAFGQGAGPGGACFQFGGLHGSPNPAAYFCE